MADIKKRRVSDKDHQTIAKHIQNEMKSRESSEARKKHERVWKILDDIIAMVPPNTAPRSGNPDEDYHAAIQMGALADALEIISADVLRFAFPVDHKWFVSHVELPSVLNEDGTAEFDPKRQRIADGVYRSLLSQQHSDFSLRDRVKASIKEGLSHGSIVVEVDSTSDRVYSKKGSEQKLTAPTWVPHSIWNCFPDPSPSACMGVNGYKGSMIIRSFMKPADFKAVPHYFHKDDVKMTQKSKDKDAVLDDVELITWYGDLYIPRSDGDIHLPNYKCVLANGTLVYASENKLPFNNIMYFGYEKDDVRDPYYTSPLIKRAPTHKLATELVNRYVDGAERYADPPGFYDSYDAELVDEGGPKTWPGSMTPVKGGGQSVSFMEVGDPTPIFQAAQILFDDIRQGTSVDSNRAGVSASGDVTATEVRNNAARGEVRTVDFLSVLDRNGLRPFLNIQHALNKMELDNYPFFNNQIETPDFLRMTKKQVPPTVIFEVVGSKAVLGEEQRNQKFLAAVQLSAQVPFLAGKTDWDEVAMEVWSFSGTKDAERFVLNDRDTEFQQIKQQYEQVIQEMQQQMQGMAEEAAKQKLDLNVLEVTIADLEGEMKIMEEQQQLERSTFKDELKIRELLNKLKLQAAKLNTDQAKREAKNAEKSVSNKSK
ncbi:MAG: hypothetical protein ACXABY_20245 [Candidatus Thorarchaeota archaeon]|jgi:hypothetical protein